MSPRQIEILKSEVNKMLELKIIEPGESDFTSPLILVEAQGKEARPCIDYRRLNKVTRTQFFPLPNIEELLEKVSAAKYISILDLTRGDEAHFWLNGYVNKQNCRIWSGANPQVYVETPLHPEKLTVWCALWAGGILLQKR
ncbi:retrovirus-related Pol polyprotein from transposon 17.6 [Trichonephila clavipes]|nr:retrovirus-related Pol polyprotein from transposon 17.6 [Trichonephila clavipes]